MQSRYSSIPDEDDPNKWYGTEDGIAITGKMNIQEAKDWLDTVRLNEGSEA